MDESDIILQLLKLLPTADWNDPKSRATAATIVAVGAYYLLKGKKATPKKRK